MALLKFVRNVKDISDDGGYQFRFCCDQCGDGVDSEYVSSSANLLKTGMEIFSIFAPRLGGSGRRAAGNIDRGLRGKERDAAYEKAVHKAMAFFRKCSGCGKWVCPDNCWNAKSGMCDTCTPNEEETALKQQAKQKKIAVEQGMVPPTTAMVACAVCKKRTAPGKFCSHCGAGMGAIKCRKCNHALEAGARFCSECGTAAS